MGVAQNITTATAGPGNAVTIELGQGLAGTAVSVQILGTWTATLAFEVSNDGGVTYFAIAGFPVGASGALGAAAATTTGNDEWVFTLGGFSRFRVRCTAYTSGEANVTIEATAGGGYGGAASAGAGAPGQANIYGISGSTWEPLKSNSGYLRIEVFDPATGEFASVAGSAADANDGYGGGDGQLNVFSMGRLLNAAGTFDRERGTFEATLLASAARTATTNSPDQTNYNGRGVHVSLDVTVEGPATIAIKIQGKHSVGATYYDITDFGVVYTAATDTPGPKTVALYPGIITADHVGVGAGVFGTIAKSGVLPRIWRVVVTHADATTTTYSLSAVTIL